MPNTLNRSYPWPFATQTADPRLDLQRLAEAVDADVTKILGTLPYRTNSLASLNAQAGARIGDRAIINATMQTGWNGNVQWVRSGSLITVSVNVGRTAGNFQLAAWTGTRLALGLPVPAAGFIGQAPVESNGYEWPAYSAQITTDGNIDLVARWVQRDVNNGSWYRAQFTYREA